MHIKRLRVKNFRAIDSVDVAFNDAVSVIIGPNATGKTTVLEAIRFAKAMLVPRTQHEANQVLISLGAMSPHVPQQILGSALTNNQSIPLEIKCTYGISQDNLSQIKDSFQQLQLEVAQQSAGLVFSSPAQAAAFLGSPAGSTAFQDAGSRISSELQKISKSMLLEVNLAIDFQGGGVKGEFPIQQAFFATLERSLPPNKTLFSYFPADRALPHGEQPVQFGIADAGIQLESYNSQPQLKYHRLKNTVFNSIIGSDTGREQVKSQFAEIFRRILKGRELGEVGVNEVGMLSIPIVDAESKKTFEIDSLSSGEKGLILTFLLIAQNVENGGLVLLDEPELHLNPAICKEMLHYLVNEYANKRNMQFIICSHSAEILAGTFERNDCSLFHLRDGRTLARVRYHDRLEIREALKRLGSSESEALLYQGTISVEGISDVELLQAGFDDLLKRYRIVERGGRSQIEKDISRLQKAESSGEEIGKHFFLFDLDQKPTSLTSSANVRVEQLKRYCLENYLLHVEILTDLTRMREFSDYAMSNVSNMENCIKDIALKQLDEEVARSVFADLELDKISFDLAIFRNSDLSVISERLSAQIRDNHATLAKLAIVEFESQFKSLFEAKKVNMLQGWEDNWRARCNAKRLFEDLRRDGIFRGDLLRLKKEIIRLLRERRADEYEELETILRSLTASS